MMMVKGDDDEENTDYVQKRILSAKTLKETKLFEKIGDWSVGMSIFSIKAAKKSKSTKAVEK